MTTCSFLDMKSDNTYIVNFPDVIKNIIFDILFNFEHYKKLYRHNNFYNLPLSVIEMYEQKISNNDMDYDSLWLYKYIDFYCENMSNIDEFIWNIKYRTMSPIYDYDGLISICNEYHHSNNVIKLIKDIGCLESECYEDFCDAKIYVGWNSDYGYMEGTCVCGKNSITQKEIPSNYEDFNIELGEILYDLDTNF